ncbi:type I restriction-modification system subunit M N-terminal domain-containing protein [Lysinibacillus sp. NPDC093197]|uniref:type I restriction-modification system subunit M N-terminal domain-containing protein n=1 Tax=Lysinibacillus sp. NPDC093197 TaxID=3364132 RepID=UPI00382ABC8D
MDLFEKDKIKKEFNEKLWVMADKLRAEFDSTSYKESIIQLLFLKYISDQHDFKFPEPKNLNNSLDHRLTYYKYSNGGITNDNK